MPSPKPLGIMNEKVVELMARQGTIIIAAGGGGIPVYIDDVITSYSIHYTKLYDLFLP